MNREAGPKQKKERQDNLRMINEKIILQQALLAYQDETHLFGFMMFFSLDKLMLIDREWVYYPPYHLTAPTVDGEQEELRLRLNALPFFLLAVQAEADLLNSLEKSFLQSGPSTLWKPT